MLQNVVITAKSGNEKTGPIAVTGRPRETCPLTCTFNPLNPDGGGGCYTAGRIDAYYARSSVDWTLEEATARLRLAKSDRLRDRVDGDVLDPSGEIDHEYLSTLTDAAVEAGMNWIWGYTHVPTLEASDVPEAYSMNASCETELDVQSAFDRGLPAVIASATVQHGDVVAGAKVVQCPATRSDVIDCSSCGGQAGPICARKDRSTVVLFPLHGGGAKKAARSIDARLAMQGA